MSLFQNLFKSSFANSAVTFWIQCSIYYILGKGSHYSNHSKLQLFYFFFFWFKWKSSFGTTSEKIKSKKRDFGPFSLDPYPPTIKRDIWIRDIFYFILKILKISMKIQSEKLKKGLKWWPEFIFWSKKFCKLKGT